jgi:hypothetical protein
MRISPTAIAAAMGNRRKDVLKIIKLKAIFSAAATIVTGTRTSG